MLKGIDIRQRIEFTPSTDTTEPKTVFILKPLSSLEMMEFETINGQGQILAIKFYLETSIVEVKNFNTSDVKEAITQLDGQTLGELMVKLNIINNISKGEIKNS